MVITPAISHLIKASSVLRFAQSGNALEAVEGAYQLAEALVDHGAFKQPKKNSPSKKKSEQTVDPKTPTDMRPSECFKSYLQEVCQSRGWPLPQYEVRKGSTIGFESRVSIHYFDESLVSEWVGASRKKAAEKAAAQYMVEVMIPEHDPSFDGMLSTATVENDGNEQDELDAA